MDVFLSRVLSHAKLIHVLQHVWRRITIRAVLRDAKQLTSAPRRTPNKVNVRRRTRTRKSVSTTVRQMCAAERRKDVTLSTDKERLVMMLKKVAFMTHVPNSAPKNSRRHR